MRGLGRRDVKLDSNVYICMCVSGRHMDGIRLVILFCSSFSCKEGFALIGTVCEIGVVTLVTIEVVTVFILRTSCYRYPGAGWLSLATRVPCQVSSRTIVGVKRSRA